MLAQLVHSDQPVAVTGEDDEFIGMLSRKVVELVTPALSETVPAEGAEAAPDLPQPEGSAEVQAGPERRATGCLTPLRRAIPLAFTLREPARQSVRARPWLHP